MNDITRPYRSPRKSHLTTLIALYVITLAVFIGLFFVTRSFASDSRIVTVHADDKEFSIRTNVETVGEAIEKSGVELNEGDLVEPLQTQKIDADNFHINVFRARQVTVVDGSKQVPVLTAHQSPELVVEQAGIEVFDEDILTYERVDDFVAQQAIGLRLIIDRALEVELDLFGKQSTVRTQAETIDDFIAEKGITIDENIEFSPDTDAEIIAGMDIEFVRNGRQLITAEEPVAFETEVINDSSKNVGTEEVQTAGVRGVQLVTYEVVLENGEEVERNKIESVVTKQPQAQVVIKGTKPVAPTAASISGTKEDWMRAAGIPESDWQYVNFIVQRESSWNPNAVNPSSGACGLAQQLPCGKWDGWGAWNDPVAALKAQQSYVNRRYGGYAGAYAFWQVNHWY